MKVVRRAVVTAETLTSSNVPEVAPAAWDSGTAYAEGDLASIAAGTLRSVYESLAGANTGNDPETESEWWLLLGTTYAEYDAGTTYAAGAIVISTATDREYESVQAGNTGHALTDESWWLDRGSVNRYKMFDHVNASQTTRAQVIDVTFTVPGGRVDAVGLLNISGATAQVIVTTESDGEIYNETANLISSNDVTNWWEYFFEPVTRRGDYVFTGIPSFASPTVRVILSDPNGTAAIGSLIAGQSFDLGDTVVGMKIGIRDFSRKELNAFGDATLVERTYSRRAGIKTMLDKRRFDPAVSLLSELRATVSLWIGVEDIASSYLLGWPSDWSGDVGHPWAEMSFDLEGIT